MSQSHFNVSAEYKGNRTIVVPCNMYSKKKLLSALHVQSSRWFGIDLDKYVISFHKHRGETDPSDEVHFSQIRSVDADLSKSDSDKYYLSIQTDQEQYRFKFKNIRDFHAVVEALRHTLHNNQPLYVTRDDFVKLANLHKEQIAQPLPDMHTSTSVNFDISDDDEKEIHHAMHREQAHTEIVTSIAPMPVITQNQTHHFVAGSQIDRTNGPIPDVHPYPVDVGRPHAQTAAPAGSTITETHTEKTVTQTTNSELSPLPIIAQTPVQAQTIVYPPVVKTDTSALLIQGVPQPLVVGGSTVTEEEYQYLKWKYMDRHQPGHEQLPERFQSFYTRDSDPHGVHQEQRRAFESRHVEYQQQFQAGIHSIAPPNSIHHASSSITTSGAPGIGRFGTEQFGQTTSVQTTTTFTNPGYVTGKVVMNEAEWRAVERQLIEQEKLIALKNEELRAREAALHSHKITLKQQEMATRAEVLSQKEAELELIERDIKGIQTDITTIQNQSAIYRQDLSAYNQSLQAQRQVPLGIIPAKDAEIVEVTVQETKVVQEKLETNIPVISTATLVDVSIPVILSQQNQQN